MFPFHHGSWTSIMLRFCTSVAMLCVSACIALVEWLMLIQHTNNAEFSLA